MELTGRRIALFIDNVYQELEAWYPYYRFLEAGAEVVIVGAGAKTTYTSKTGYPMTSHKAYSDVRADEFHGLVIPGGFAPDYIRRHSAALEFTRAMDRQGGLVAAICHALWVPCSANILRGRRCTSFYAIKDDVVNAGGLWEDSPVVIDGNLVTSRKPEDLPLFMQACLEVVRVSAHA